MNLTPRGARVQAKKAALVAAQIEQDHKRLQAQVRGQQALERHLEAASGFRDLGVPLRGWPWSAMQRDVPAEPEQIIADPEYGAYTCSPIFLDTTASPVAGPSTIEHDLGPAGWDSVRQRWVSTPASEKTDALAERVAQLEALLSGSAPSSGN